MLVGIIRLNKLAMSLDSLNKGPKIKSAAKVKDERDRHMNKWSFSKSIVYVLFWVVTWAIIGGVFVAGLAWLIGAQLGFDTYAPNITDSQTTQIIFWLAIWGSIIFFVVSQWLLRYKKRDFWRISRKVLLGYVLLGLVGGLWGAAVLHHGQNLENTRAASCNLQQTLDKAISATYPIATPESSGTAFAIDANGTLVTAHHVIDGQSAVYMDFTSGRESLEVLKTSPEYDLALLKYSKPTPNFLSLHETPELAEQVYALGWPANAFYSGQSTISSGIVSRIISSEDAQRNFEGIPADISFIQSDVAINPGNSGGALINKCGVIGMVDAISEAGVYQGLPREEGISYSISSSTIKKVFGL